MMKNTVILDINMSVNLVENVFRLQTEILGFVKLYKCHCSQLCFLMPSILCLLLSVP